MRLPRRKQKIAYARRKTTVIEVWLKKNPASLNRQSSNRKVNKLVNEDTRGRESSTSGLRK